MKHWPFTESLERFAERLQAAVMRTENLTTAVRSVIIEEPQTLSDSYLLDLGLIGADSTMKHITDCEELEIGREYWTVTKDRNYRIETQILTCEADGNWKYFGNQHWAEPSNNQAMKKWDIYGPLPVRRPPDFDSLKGTP